MDTETTYPVEVTGEQAHILASWLSLMAQDAASEETEERSEQYRSEVNTLAPVGKRFAEIAEEAGEWEA